MYGTLVCLYIYILYTSKIMKRLELGQYVLET